MIDTNNQNSNNDDVQEIISMIENSPEDFSHLQIFLSREGMANWSCEDEFLMITPTSFGKVKLLNVSVEDNYIIIEIKDCSTKQVGNVRIDINANPQTFFIYWQDIKKMVLTEPDIFNPKDNNDDLLEFCF